MNDDLSAHLPGRAPHRLSSAGRLIEALACDGAVDSQRLAQDVGVRVELLESCRRGEARLPLELQMRLAAVALLHAPQLTRQARALYAQAQAALRLEAGEVAQHRTYPNGPFESLPRRHERSTALGDGASLAGRRARAGAADVQTSERSYSDESLAAAARVFERRLADPYQSSSAEAAALLRDEVTRAAQTLRANDEAPEHALVRVKSAVESVLTGSPTTRRDVMESVVRWFVDAYYGA